MPPAPHYELAKIDLHNVIADREAIRAVNPQRHEMEQIDAVVFIDQQNQVFCGYKDVRTDEFWVRGHMPGYPLMPGVMMCEASAQLCGYFVAATKIFPTGDFLGFGGLENVRFRGTVHPGDRLVLIAKTLKLHRRQCIFNVQGFVGDTMVFHCDVIGVPMHKKAEG